MKTGRQQITTAVDNLKTNQGWIADESHHKTDVRVSKKWKGGLVPVQSDLTLFLVWLSLIDIIDIM